MKIYLDTSILNDAHILIKINSGEKYTKNYKRELKNWIKEYLALRFLLYLDDEWELKFITSPVTKEEIKKFQSSRKFNHELYLDLSNFYNILIEKIDFIPFNIGKESIKEVKNIGIKDIDDCRHICYAKKMKCDFFITTDKNTIVKYKNKLERFGIKVRLPSQFIEENFMDLKILIRTLYGSWTSYEQLATSLSKDIVKYSIQPSSK